MYSGFLGDIMNQAEEAQKVMKKTFAPNPNFGTFNINYLDDNIFIMFISVTGDHARRILFAKGGSILGYSDKGLIGMEYSVVIPTSFREYHNNPELFLSLFSV
jgi:hypothetical protein